MIFYKLLPYEIDSAYHFHVIDTDQGNEGKSNYIAHRLR